MLDTAKNLFEKQSIKAMLGTTISAAGDLCVKQYGFRSEMSTEDAIQEVREAVRRAEDHNHLSRR